MPIDVQCLKVFTQNFQAEICLKPAFSTQVRSALLTFGAIVATRVSVTFKMRQFPGCWVCASHGVALKTLLTSLCSPFAFDSRWLFGTVKLSLVGHMESNLDTF